MLTAPLKRPHGSAGAMHSGPQATEGNDEGARNSFRSLLTALPLPLCDRMHTRAGAENEAELSQKTHAFCGGTARSGKQGGANSAAMALALRARPSHSSRLLALGLSLRCCYVQVSRSATSSR